MKFILFHVLFVQLFLCVHWLASAAFYISWSSAKMVKVLAPLTSRQEIENAEAALVQKRHAHCIAIAAVRLKVEPIDIDERWNMPNV